MALILAFTFARLANVCQTTLLYVLHLEDSQEDMLLSSIQCCQHTESVYLKKSSEEQVQKILKCQILYIAVEQDN